jgi:hypothetical protein
MKKLVKQIAELFIVAVIVSLLNGCSREADVEIFNNTDSAIKIMSEGHEFLVEKNSLCQLTFGNLAKGIAVWVNGKTLAYKSSFLDERGIYKLLKHGSKINVLTLQLNADGFVYIVSGEKKLPVNQYPNQPDGYPLQPNK